MREFLYSTCHCSSLVCSLDSSSLRNYDKRKKGQIMGNDNDASVHGYLSLLRGVPVNIVLIKRCPLLRVSLLRGVLY